jgi:hypothetical protein
MTRSPLFFPLVALVSLPVVACTAAENTAVGARAVAKETFEGASEVTTDASITFAINGALLEDDGVRSREVRVTTHHGVVTLTGTQPTVEARARVDAIARRVRGVVAVDDRIVVPGAPPFLPPPGAAPLPPPGPAPMPPGPPGAPMPQGPAPQGPPQPMSPPI